MATHYELLGVAPGASHDEIQRAYRKLARDHHPDTKAGEGTAAAEHAREIMASVNAAWSVLGDPPRRAAYDQQLNRPAPAPDKPSTDGESDWVFEGEADEGGPDESGPADLVVLIPAGLFALSVAAFTLSLMSQSSAAMALALVLLIIAGLSFLVMPLIVMMRRARARARATGTTG